MEGPLVPQWATLCSVFITRQRAVGRRRLVVAVARLARAGVKREQEHPSPAMPRGTTASPRPVYVDIARGRTQCRPRPENEDAATTTVTEGINR